MFAIRAFSTIWLGALTLTAVAMARPEPAVPPDAPADARPNPADVPPEARGQAGAPPPGAMNHRGAGGVGFSAPHKLNQLEAIKGQLEAGDDAWKTLGPKVEKVLVAKQNTSTGAGMNYTASNNAAPVFRPSSQRPDTPCGWAMQEVRDAAADEKVSDEQLTARMTAVREARQQARGEYEAAQKELLDVLTPRQQAVLMTLGVVE